MRIVVALFSSTRRLAAVASIAVAVGLCSLAHPVRAQDNHQHAEAKIPHITHLVSEKNREIAIISALVVMGDRGQNSFATHVNAALDSGARRQEVVEMIATLSQCSGSPTAVNAIAAATRVFDSRDASGRVRPGELVFEPGDAPVSEGNDARFLNAQKTIEKVYPAGPHDDTYTRVKRVAPDFTRNFLTMFYNDLFLHPGLDLKTRELGIFASLASMGIVSHQLRWHTFGALNNEWTREQLLEVIDVLEPIIGHSNAAAAIMTVHDVVDERGRGG
jgi:alkylhydroperoxidase/carboxymuconolactone decarboxylase family protein YurZ